MRCCYLLFASLTRGCTSEPLDAPAKRQARRGHVRPAPTTDGASTAMLHTIAQLEGEVAAQRERADSARAAGEKEAAKLKLQLKRRARAARGDKEQGKTDHE